MPQALHAGAAWVVGKGAPRTSFVPAVRCSVACPTRAALLASLPASKPASRHLDVGPAEHSITFSSPRSNPVSSNGKAEIALIAGARTPMAEWIGGKRGDGLPGGLLASVSAIDLGAVAARAAIERAAIDPGLIDHVVLGNAMQTLVDALYGARHVALKAGLRQEIPALTVNRLCRSGIQSVVEAAQQIAAGESSWVLAGGMENMSQAPHVIRGARAGLRLGQGQLEDSLMVALLDTHCGLYMAQTSDNLARRHAISREDMDAYALRSQKAAAGARARGVFKDEIAPVDAPQRRQTIR